MQLLKIVVMGFLSAENFVCLRIQSSWKILDWHPSRLKSSAGRIHLTVTGFVLHLYNTVKNTKEQKYAGISCETTCTFKGETNLALSLYCIGGKNHSPQKLGESKVLKSDLSIVTLHQCQFLPTTIISGKSR